jgi:hypothetical protein
MYPPQKYVNWQMVPDSNLASEASDQEVALRLKKEDTPLKKRPHFAHRKDAVNAETMLDGR